ncbi:MAG: 6-pyruvoyl trahydropterin synthase family protein [Planctomycetota bacterium]|jgi:6-pyruvoyltetrahydropterin/6-carboxytetrahydropterin synthase
MFTISVERHFQASHQLTLPDGSKEPLHDHDWVVTADLSSEKLNNMGVVMDFKVLQAMIDKTVAVFNQKTLDSIGYFQRNNSSAENVAKYIYEKLLIELPEGVKLRNVRVVEEPGCSAKFQQ